MRLIDAVTNGTLSAFPLITEYIEADWAHCVPLNPSTELKA
jgi:hypothetical protein